jgi:hypothetical protein
VAHPRARPRTQPGAEAGRAFLIRPEEEEALFFGITQGLVSYEDVRAWVADREHRRLR